MFIEQYIITKTYILRKLQIGTSEFELGQE